MKKTVTVRLTEAERDVLDAWATLEGVRPAEMARRALVDDLGTVAAIPEVAALVSARLERQRRARSEEAEALERRSQLRVVR